MTAPRRSGLLQHAAGGLVIAFVGAISAIAGMCLGGLLLLCLGSVLFALVDLPDPEAQAIFLGWCGWVLVPAGAVLVVAIALLDLAWTNAPAAPAGHRRYALRWAVGLCVAPLAAFASAQGAPSALELDQVLGAWAPWVAALAALLLAGMGASADLVWLAGRATPHAPAPTSKASPRDLAPAAGSDPG